MSSRKKFEAWYWQEISANQDFMPVCWEAWQARDAEVAELVQALRSCKLAMLESMRFYGNNSTNWSSMIETIDALLAKHEGEAR